MDIESYKKKLNERKEKFKKINESKDISPSNLKKENISEKNKSNNKIDIPIKTTNQKNTISNTNTNTNKDNENLIKLIEATKSGKEILSYLSSLVNENKISLINMILELKKIYSNEKTIYNYLNKISSEDFKKKLIKKRYIIIKKRYRKLNNIQKRIMKEDFFKKEIIEMVLDELKKNHKL